MPTNLSDKIDIQNRLQDNDRAVRYQALCDAALYFQSGVTLDSQLLESVISTLRDEDKEIVYEAAEVLVRASETQGSANLVFKTFKAKIRDFVKMQRMPWHLSKLKPVLKL